MSELSNRIVDCKLFALPQELISSGAKPLCLPGKHFNSCMNCFVASDVACVRACVLTRRSRYRRFRQSLLSTFTVVSATLIIYFAELLLLPDVASSDIYGALVALIVTDTLVPSSNELAFVHRFEWQDWQITRLLAHASCNFKIMPYYSSLFQQKVKAGSIFPFSKTKEQVNWPTPLAAQNLDS